MPWCRSGPGPRGGRAPAISVPLRLPTVPAITFPDGFLWGTATAAHQIEGGNINNDWWAMEHDPTSGCADVSGDACDSFNRYPEDIALVAGLGFSSYRFSLEWSRIEPEDGEFSLVALDHYRRMAATCHEHGILPVVTFHHFTHPRWLAAAGTWEALHAPDRFARFCDRATAHLGDLIGMACTLNEPNVVATMGWRHGVFPPRVRDRVRRDVVNQSLVTAHRKAVDAIRSGPGDFPVGLTLSMTDYQLQPGGEEWLERLRRPSEDVFLEATGGDDYLGVQNYTRVRVGARGVPRPGGGGPHLADGIRGVAGGPRGHDPASLGQDGRSPDVRHRKRHRDRRRRTAHRLREAGAGRGAALSRRRGRRARVLLLEPLGQLRVGARLRPHLRPRGGGP